MSSSEKKLERFVQAQEKSYQDALAELKSGRKRSHWMWYVFPQIKGLGFSEMARFYAIEDIKEAEDYLAHPVLGKRLIEITQVLIELNEDDANKVFGYPDDMKLKSSMTLFANINRTDPVFLQVIDKYFHGKQDVATLRIIGNPSS
ncbi:DUF1810 domain-containing protein [Pedobacter sp. Leaf176]|uniref:DUF1810 domain-containing protein n=1 Tax=Pedobacter sp. Leaf176 TaxID=1736286 RepID=UPI0006FFE065|nr:DUF1810 domain-containing protein [Pedobacter sp. Leaf176]KQR71217.1 calpastatin [Pedobacter sp. Leaf176]